MIRFIGFYDYTVILTFLSLFSAVFGMTQAAQGNCMIATFCLAFSGICDAFDGRVARKKKNRTQDEKNYGIQLDSLVDVISFGFFPAMICYFLGVQGVLGLVLVGFFSACAVIRLAFFNVMEEKRQKEEGGCAKYYRGLPVTSISILLPLVYWLHLLLSQQAFLILLHVLLGGIGLLFILDFPLRKPGLKGILMLIGIALVLLAGILCAAFFLR